MAIEIVDFPIKNGGSFHSFLYVYQRVTSNFHRRIVAFPTRRSSCRAMRCKPAEHHSAAAWALAFGPLAGEIRKVGQRLGIIGGYVYNIPSGELT